MEQYHNESQQRMLKVLKALAGHELEGLTASELRARVETSPANLTRDLFNLKAGGWIEQIPYAPERWRLGTMLMQIAHANLQHITSMQQRIAEMQKRYQTLPN